MNKNLKLLVERARGSVPPGLTTEQWIDYYNQSFAELIVNECAAQCEVAGDVVIADQMRHWFGIGHYREQNS